MKLIITKNTITGSYNNERLFVYREGFQSRYPKTKILPTFSATAKCQNRNFFRNFSSFRVVLLAAFQKTSFSTFFDEKITLGTFCVPMYLFDFGAPRVFFPFFLRGALSCLFKNHVFLLFLRFFSKQISWRDPEPKQWICLFFSWLVCRNAISAWCREFTFFNNFATLLIMALL